MTEGFDESSFADRYGADVTEAAVGLMQSVFEDVPSDELWLEWCALDRLIGEADERAHKEVGGGAFDLYMRRAEELWAPIFDRPRRGRGADRQHGSDHDRGLFGSTSSAERAMDI
jgi:hypothetical protein